MELLKEQGSNLIGCEREVTKLPFTPPGIALYSWQGCSGDDKDRQNVVGDDEYNGDEHCKRKVALGVLNAACHVAGKGKPEHVVDNDSNHAVEE